jgi:hypothetical protein
LTRTAVVICPEYVDVRRWLPDERVDEGVGVPGSVLVRESLDDGRESPEVEPEGSVDDVEAGDHETGELDVRCMGEFRNVAAENVLIRPDEPGEESAVGVDVNDSPRR